MYRNKWTQDRLDKRANAAISIREFTEGDAPFIFNSWLKSFRNGLAAKYVDNTIYFTEQHKIIERLLKRAKFKIACSPTAVEDIYGYICYEHIDGIYVLHYCYVKQTYRNLGVFTALMTDTGHNFDGAGLFTHSTKVSHDVMPKYNLIYHPYILNNYMDSAGVEK
jgi:hypothetical protein